MLTKEQLRSKMIKKLKTQKEEEQSQKSRIIANKLLKTKVFKQAKNVMFYIAFGGEVETADMMRVAKRLGKRVTVPVCHDGHVTLRPCLLDEFDRLQKGPHGVCEPSTKRFLRLKDLDLVIVPGLAFDKKGNRLGRGRGCYDRLLELLPQATPTIGLGFDFQILPFVPAKTHDINVGRVIFA
jgi:5-formyltetrahydrofolate cyclo-ligase